MSKLQTSLYTSCVFVCILLLWFYVLSQARLQKTCIRTDLLGWSAVGMVVFVLIWGLTLWQIDRDPRWQETPTIPISVALSTMILLMLVLIKTYHDCKPSVVSAEAINVRQRNLDNLRQFV